MVFVFGLVAASAQAQTLSTLYSFTGGSAGETPLAGLTSDGAALYGTASSGASGYGAIFKLERSGSTWSMIPLHSFASGSDGATPEARVMIGPDRTFYGTTSGGGASGAGTVYHLGPGGESVIYVFQGGSDGFQPSSGDLLFDKGGDIYGTTSYGGSNNNGTVFELMKPKTGGAWTEKQLYAFGTGTDGAVPIGGVVFDKAGNLYGTTSLGGAYGYGTVYELERSGSVWTETILYSFQDGTDGGTPYAGLIIDKSGNLYGATVSGGLGGGAVFELSPNGSNWNFSAIYGIAGSAISGPFRNLVFDSVGNLWGTTHCDGPTQLGTVFELTPSSGTWTNTLEYDFTGGTGGNYLFTNLVLDKQGNVYGTTSLGGEDYAGMIFEITP